jgi:hypothetical protein
MNKLPLAFNLNQDKQFAPSKFKTMAVIESIESKDVALSVLTRIIKGGEGDLDHPDSHYATFRDFYSSYAKKPWKYQQVPLSIPLAIKKRWKAAVLLQPHWLSVREN